MQPENPEPTRRKFMRKSALAVGALAGSASLLSGESNSQIVDPRANTLAKYPWDLSVGGAAQASLYLFGSRPLRRLLLEPLSKMLLEMQLRRAIRHATDRDRAKLQRAIHASVDGTLLPALVRAHLAIRRVPSGHPKTYLELARTPRTGESGWDTSLYAALSNLGGTVLVPLLKADWRKAENLEKRLIEKYGSRTLKELFTMKHSSIPKEELEFWHTVRDAGLIWCNPRPSGTFDVGNEWKCNPSTLKCVFTGDSDDYCQEVDGECNAMGT